MKLLGLYLGILFPLLLPLEGHGQVSAAAELGMPLYAELGMPLYTVHFTPGDYDGYFQNWGVVQDPRGVIYVGNTEGVLEYDGEQWRRIPTPTTARSLAVGAEGTVYVGLQGDFGYLKPDSVGLLKYASLLPVPAGADPVFKDVWGVHMTPEGVYFQTREYLFRWDGRHLRQWESVNGFHTSFEVRGKFYVREMGIGLQTMEGDSLHLVPGGTRFANSMIYMMAPYGARQILIGTRYEGFFLYDGITFTPFPTEADAFLKQYNLYYGSAMPGGLFALATLGGGVLILDAQGRLVGLLDAAAELPDGVINYVYPDRQGGLWLSLNNSGIVRVSFPSPVTRFDDALGLGGAVFDMVRYRGAVYAATGAGVYRLEAYPLADRIRQQHSHFVPVLQKDRKVPRAWGLLSADSVLFVATDEGLYRIDDGVGQPMEGTQALPVFILLESSVYKGRIYAGRKNGVAVLQSTPTGWHLRRVEGVDEDVRWLVEDQQGALWVGTRHEGILRLRFEQGLDAPPHIDHFGVEQGLPDNSMALAYVADRPLFYSTRGNGVYRFHDTPQKEDPAMGLFYPDAELSPFLEAAGDSLLMLAEDQAGSVWIAYANRVVVAERQPDGGYERREPVDLRFAKTTVEMIYPEDRVVWFSSGDLLYRYDRDIQTHSDTTFQALIRQIRTVALDELLFGGTYRTEAGVVSVAQRAALAPVLPYRLKELYFEFSALGFNHLTPLQYQYYLEGTEAGWSAWTTVREKTIVSLDEGSYRLHLRARNERGEVSREAVFAFRILPPWYRTWWAYVLYLFGACGVLFLGWKYREMVKAQRLAAQQAWELARERLVNERLQQANQSLQVANERLKQANKLKDEFLATTSHELRTPLTAILGFTDVLKCEIPEDAPYREFLGIIEQSGNRLMHTLTSLLEIAKLRAGVLELHREPVNLSRQAAEVLRMFSEMARQKDVALELVEPPQPIFAMIDSQAYERILSNLVGNAVKFTEAGRVSITFEQEQEQVCVYVRDTGIGIAENFLPDLFEEFRQESDGLARTHEGTGLGLAITARLVRLMDGEISVESRKNEGSIFRVAFPLYIPSKTISTGGISAAGDGWATGTRVQ